LVAWLGKGKVIEYDKDFKPIWTYSTPRPWSVARLHNGNTLIQDKVLVGLSAGLVSQPHETLIQEYLALPLKDTVKDKWLYGNAARVFRLA
jgi:predicted TIM-barrel fold metal-dependent hydrolase